MEVVLGEEEEVVGVEVKVGEAVGEAGGVVETSEEAEQEELDELFVKMSVGLLVPVFASYFTLLILTIQLIVGFADTIQPYHSAYLEYSYVF